MSKRDYRIDLFAEDRAHEMLISALVKRIALEQNTIVELQVRSAIGGHGRALAEYENYQKLLERNIISKPDLFVIAIDANCTKYTKKCKEIIERTHDCFRHSVVAACPDPHIEKWFFVDPETFYKVVGVSPSIGRKKRKKDFYKSLLANAVRNAGHIPVLGGLEFAREIAEKIDIYRAEKNDHSIQGFFRDLRNALPRS